VSQAVAPTLADVGAVDDFEHAVPKVVNANGRELVVYKWHDRMIALRNICAHQGMSFKGGRVVEHVRSGATRTERHASAEPELVCPVHGYSYDSGGQCTTHAHLRIKSYPVEIRDGRVLVQVGK
jgi:nitrite reductase/ring-hydroxylating ferredoxin subunit